MNADPFPALAKKLVRYQQGHPKSRRYPPAIWAQILELAKIHSPKVVAQRLKISYGQLTRKMKGQQKLPRRLSIPSIANLVQVPLSGGASTAAAPCLMELQYPNGIKIRVFAQ